MNKKLSTEPSQVRRRLSRAVHGGSTRRIARDVAILEETGVIKPIADWDLEELARGKPRNKGGGFSGPAPGWMNAAVRAEIEKRFHEEALDTLRSHLPTAIKALVSLAKSPDTDARVKADVWKYIIDQILGRPAVRVAFEAKVSPFEGLAAALVLPGGVAAHPVIEGAVIPDDDLEDDLEDDEPPRSPSPYNADPVLIDDETPPRYVQSTNGSRSRGDQ